jgi:hypothetical protein
MEFRSANPSVIRSIKQRELLDTWLRALRRAGPLPGLADFNPERVGDELCDMMSFAVEGEGCAARFVITHEGARLTSAYGSEHIEPAKRTNRYLDERIGPERYARVLPCYRACLSFRRPTYSISAVRDADGREVTYERLLLPFGGRDAVKAIVGSYKAISIEGNFRIGHLMGADSAAAPVRLVNAVIDRELPQPPVGVRAANDIVIVN